LQLAYAYEQAAPWTRTHLPSLLSASSKPESQIFGS